MVGKKNIFLFECKAVDLLSHFTMGLIKEPWPEIQTDKIRTNVGSMFCNIYRQKWRIDVCGSL